MVPQENVKDQKPPTVIVFILIATLLWILAGIAAFVMSVVCFGKSGTASQHVVGLLLAFFFGPFYWIYYLVSKDYCT